MREFENFCKTVDNLEEINRRIPPYDVVVTAGLCSLFVQCFEQAWRVVKEYLMQKGWEGVDTASPRQILKMASEAGLIHDESNWLKAMKEKSLALYVFHQEVADTMITDTRNIFHPLFRDLRDELGKRDEM